MAKVPAQPVYMVDPLANNASVKIATKAYAQPVYTVDQTGAPASSGGTAAGVTNLKASNTQKIRAALIKAKTGRARARIITVGDSTTSGVGAPNKLLSYPMQLATEFGARGIPNRSDFSYSIQNDDPRWVIPAAWTSASNQMRVNNTDSSVLSFTPIKTDVDTFDVFLSDGGGASATISLQIDSGAITTFTLGGTNNWVKRTLTATAGTHTLNMFRSAGTGQVRVVGVEAYSSTAKDLAVLNMGLNASLTSDWGVTGFGYSPRTMATNLAGDAYIINLGINDADFGGNLTSYAANLQSMITSFKAIGDVILVFPNPWSGNSSAAVQQQYAAVMYNLSASNDIPLFDLNLRWKDYATVNSLGLMFNTLHPNEAFYNDEARWIATAILGS
jgi:lysophospholipase L1-like esterase